MTFLFSLELYHLPTNHCSWFHVFEFHEWNHPEWVLLTTCYFCNGCGVFAVHFWLNTVSEMHPCCVSLCFMFTAGQASIVWPGQDVLIESAPGMHLGSFQCFTRSSFSGLIILHCQISMYRRPLGCIPREDVLGIRMCIFSFFFKIYLFF